MTTLSPFPPLYNCLMSFDPYNHSHICAPTHGAPCISSSCTLPSSLALDLAVEACDLLLASRRCDRSFSPHCEIDVRACDALLRPLPPSGARSLWRESISCVCLLWCAFAAPCYVFCMWSASASCGLWAFALCGTPSNMCFVQK